MIKVVVVLRDTESKQHNSDKSVTEKNLRDFDRSHVEVQGSNPRIILGE
jgi:hypothetical protein